MNRSKIEWCDMTWNPITGCLNNCEYCYAKRLIKRFSDYPNNRLCAEYEKPIEIYHGDFAPRYKSEGEGFYTKGIPMPKLTKKTYTDEGAFVPYPYRDMPTFHTYRLDEPQKITRPQNIFVCSMADLFGDWIPDEWIKEVFNACEKAPQHNYLFLTKNPERYVRLADSLPQNDNFWYGSTMTNHLDKAWYYDGKSYRAINTNHPYHRKFISIEPMQGEFYKGVQLRDFTSMFGWIIVGAETGNRKDKIIPKREWIENIVESCKNSEIPLFMKNSLTGVWGEPLIQEYPWEGRQ